MSNDFQLKWTGRLCTGMLNSVLKVEVVGTAQMGSNEGQEEEEVAVGLLGRVCIPPALRCIRR